MIDLWLQDIESLEAVSQDEQHEADLPAHGRDVAGRHARPRSSRNLRHDDELDEGRRARSREIAQDANFLLAVEDYVHRTRLLQLTTGAEQMGDPGFEPGTSALSERRSNQLS